MNQRSYDLEERLVEFSSQVIDVVEALTCNKSSQLYCWPIGSLRSRSGFLYGEAQSSESRDDFIHKMKIGLKELKETRILL